MAEQIRRVILLRIVPPGGRLPYEPELADALGVSRTTVSQALQTLQREHLLSVRRGRGGGVFVSPVSTDGEDSAVLAELAATSDAIEAAAEARMVIEPAVAALAAERADRGQLARLEALNAEMLSAEGDDHAFMRADTSFHLGLAQSSGNPYFLDAVERTRLALTRALEVLPDSPAWHARSVAQHERILASLRSRSSQAARRAMARHIEGTNGAVRLLMRTLRT